jgi:uncharacterized membrane protein YphA (DoxX/SURF4 family)
MRNSHSASAHVVPLLARLVLAAAFIPLGWNKLATDDAVFRGEDARILISLGVGHASAPPEDSAPVEQGPDIQGSKDEPTVTARALYATAVKLVKSHWPTSLQPALVAWLAAIIELVGGVMILIGLFSRVWAVGMAASRACALYLTSYPAIMEHSLFALPAGDYNRLICLLAVFVLAVAVAMTGPGGLSLDRAVFRRSPRSDAPTPMPAP